MQPLWCMVYHHAELAVIPASIIIIQKVRTKDSCWLLLLIVIIALVIYNYRIWENNIIITHDSLCLYIIEHLSAKFGSHSRLAHKKHAAELISCSRAMWITSYIDRSWLVVKFITCAAILYLVSCYSNKGGKSVVPPPPPRQSP